MEQKHNIDSNTQDLVDIKEPTRYKVIMHNDEYSTWDFVVNVLKVIFKKNSDDAFKITSHIHNKGIGVCGIYMQEIAEMKMIQVHNMAKAQGFPLRCTIEEE